jgi:PIN domain nuclease of toxin-antitoxin system
MNYLLDTHTFLWFINEDESLSGTAKVLVEDSKNTAHLSIASLWEIAIKVSVGKLEIPSPFLGFMLRQLHDNNITLLEIRPEHTGIVATLPFHHRDPFDRIIIAQAVVEKLPIIGKDEIFKAYGVELLW